MAMNRLVQKKQGVTQRRSKQGKPEQNKRGGGSDVEWDFLRESEKRELYEEQKELVEELRTKLQGSEQELAAAKLERAGPIARAALDSAREKAARDRKLQQEEFEDAMKKLQDNIDELTETLTAVMFEKTEAAAALVKAREKVEELQGENAELIETLATLAKAAAAAPDKAHVEARVMFELPAPRETARSGSSRKGKGSKEKRKAERAQRFGETGQIDEWKSFVTGEWKTPTISFRRKEGGVHKYGTCDVN